MFKSWSSSKTASSRTSPNKIRSDRCRSDAFKRSRMATGRTPFVFGALRSERDLRDSIGFQRFPQEQNAFVVRNEFGEHSEHSRFSRAGTGADEDVFFGRERSLRVGSREIDPASLSESGPASRNGVLNLRMVSVTPRRLHGGITAATRRSSGSRESKMGLASEMSLPRRRAMFLTAIIKARSPIEIPWGN